MIVRRDLHCETTLPQATKIFWKACKTDANFFWMCSDGRIDPLTALHQAAEYQQHLARLMELVASPALQMLRTARVQAQWRQQQARDLRDLLHHRSHSGTNTSFELAPVPAEASAPFRSS